MLKVKNVRDKKHLDWVKTLPCCVSGVPGPSDPAHIRVRTDGGTGLKPSDFWAVPLNHYLHAQQHSANGRAMSEREFWEQHGGADKAKALARALYSVTGDTKKALLLLSEFKQ